MRVPRVSIFFLQLLICKLGSSQDSAAQSLQAGHAQTSNCAAIHNCCEGSDITLSANLWSKVKDFALSYHIRELLDSTPRMLERHYTFLSLFDRMRKTNSQQLWAADCYFGLVGILLNAIPAQEFEDGLDAAQAMFLAATQMLKDNPMLELANWSIPLEPLRLSFPFLLGLHPNNCHGSQLKVYVYDTGSYSRGSVFCSAGQWGVEVLIHRYFGSSACSTSDPDIADLFLVPDYRACHYHLAPTYMQKGLTRLEGDDYHSGVIWNHKDKYRLASEADESFKTLLNQLEYFPRKRGMDHVFVFSDQGFIVNFTHTFPSWRDFVPHSIFITTEAFTPGCGPSCFSPWKDIVIPGHLDQDRMVQIRNKSRPSQERTLLFNFHGRLPINHDYYSNNTVRSAILQFAQYPNVSVGGFIEEYFEIMGNSHFCIVPEGTSSWTNHLYESFFAGCIPLILSDNFVLPFQDLIEWEQLSVRWPQNDVDKSLYAYIRDLVENRRPVVEELHRRVVKAACWFDWYRFEEDCSPYRGIVHALEQRSAVMPRYFHPDYWAV